MTTRNAITMGNYGASWESRGYCGGGNVADLINSLRYRPAVICGNGKNVFDELTEVLRIYVDPVIFAVNDVGMFLPKIDHWVSLHSDFLSAWKAVRWLHPKEKEDVFYHSIDKRPFIDYIWQGLTPMFALSGYFAMQIAYIMGAELIILCGCPGDDAKRFFDLIPRDDFSYGGGENGSDKGVREQLINEMERLPDFKNKVRSLGGWTNSFFGGI